MTRQLSSGCGGARQSANHHLTAQYVTTIYHQVINNSLHIEGIDNEGNITVIIKRHRIGTKPVGGVLNKGGTGVTSPMDSF